MILSGSAVHLNDFLVGLVEKMLDGGPGVDDRTERAALQSPLFAKKPSDGVVEPRARGRCEMESEALMPVKPMARLRDACGRRNCR